MATQINHINGVISGIPATADGVMSVIKMPTAQGSFLHTNTARHSTGLTQIKSTRVNCRLNVVNVPINQCPQTLYTACPTMSVKLNQHTVKLMQTVFLVQ